MTGRRTIVPTGVQFMLGMLAFAGGFTFLLLSMRGISSTVWIRLLFLVAGFAFVIWRAMRVGWKMFLPGVLSGFVGLILLVSAILIRCAMF